MSIITLSKNDEWETPGDLYTKLCEKYNVRPLIDVCATRDNRKCVDYFDKQQDGLAQHWVKTFFMNPPYSELKLWLQKAYEEHKKYNITGMALIFSKTDTKAWHEYVEGKAEVHFIKGRVKFMLNNKIQDNSAPYPSAVVIWRRK